MARVFYDRVKETATVTGTSNPYALAGAETSYQAFGTVLANGATCFYCAVGRTSNSWETGLGTYTTSGDTLARTTIQESSNSNSAVNWGAETIDVFLTETAYYANNTPTNNTGAFSDYTMAVGETAYLTYSSATSLALHIATGNNQEYELIIQGDVAISPGTAGGVSLEPNNTTVTAGAIKRSQTYNTSSLTVNGSSIAYSGYEDGVSATVFTLGGNNIIHARCLISTATLAKAVLSDYIGSSTGSDFARSIEHDFWNDSSTAWTSLGTITFPFAQTGTIIIRRIF